MLFVVELGRERDNIDPFSARSAASQKLPQTQRETLSMIIPILDDLSFDVEGIHS